MPNGTPGATWLLASPSSANPDRYQASPPRIKWPAPGEVRKHCLSARLAPLESVLCKEGLERVLDGLSEGLQGREILCMCLGRLVVAMDVAICAPASAGFDLDHGSMSRQSNRVALSRGAVSWAPLRGTRRWLVPQ